MFINECYQLRYWSFDGNIVSMIIKSHTRKFTFVFSRKSEVVVGQIAVEEGDWREGYN